MYEVTIYKPTRNAAMSITRVVDTFDGARDTADLAASAQDAVADYGCPVAGFFRDRDGNAVASFRIRPLS